MALWVAGKKPDSGQFVSIGPFDNRMRANDTADKLDDGQVIELKTKNHTEAQRQIKAKLFTDASSQGLASKVLSRFKRKKADPEPEEQTLEV